VSRDSYSICETCKVFQDNGVVLNATCMDRHGTVESFNREWDMWIGKGWIPRASLGESNEGIYDFLVRHGAHGVTYWSWDWAYHDEDPLEGLTLEAVSDKV
jgi:hypothetical protein